MTMSIDVIHGLVRHPNARTAWAMTLAAAVVACGGNASSSAEQPPAQALSNAEIATKVIVEGLGQGDVAVIERYVQEDYIQHNVTAPDGRAGLLASLDTMPGGLGAKVHRTLVDDDDHVALHVTYTPDEGPPLVAFDVFRVQNGMLAEHWGARQTSVPAAQTVSGRSMVDGPTTVLDRNKTEENRQLVTEFVRNVLADGQFDKAPEYLGDTYAQHNPLAADDLEGLNAFVQSLTSQGVAFGYTSMPLLVLADGNFVLVGSEGFFGPADAPPFALFYDLWRVEQGKLVEHWDVVSAPAPPDPVPRGNGFF